jgi:hypothetical protein
LGILRRRKAGAVAFGLFSAMRLVTVPFFQTTRGLTAIRDKPASLAELVGLGTPSSVLVRSANFLLVVGSVCTFIYFKKRWSLLSGVTDSPTGTLLEAENVN